MAGFGEVEITSCKAQGSSPGPPTNGHTSNQVDAGQEPARQAAIPIANDTESHEGAKAVEEHANYHGQVTPVGLGHCPLQCGWNLHCRMRGRC